MPEKEKKLTLLAQENTVVDESAITDSYYRNRARELGLREQIEFLNFRKEWSQKLLLLVVFIVAFNALFLVIVGLGWLNYADEWLVRIVITGSFIEVLGLAKIVVEFLFRDYPVTTKRDDEIPPNT
jgi:hypothetical protein